jgi:hypothetical protein
MAAALGQEGEAHRRERFELAHEALAAAVGAVAP